MGESTHVVVRAERATVPSGDLTVHPPGRPLVVAAAGPIWATVTADTSVTALLRSDDDGASWRPRLSWTGTPLNAVVFGADRMALHLNLWPQRAAHVNGERLPPDRAWYSAIASSVDGGESWTIADVPADAIGAAHFLDLSRCWVTLLPDRHGPGPWRLAGSRDAGATWTLTPLPPGVTAHEVAFHTGTDGVLASGHSPDGFGVHVTGDGGLTWHHERLRLPRGVNRRVAPHLSGLWPAADGRHALAMRATTASEHQAGQPAAAGLYLYTRAEDGEWPAPTRLPTTCSWLFPEIVTPPRGGDLWAASDHDLWATDAGPAGPWRRARIPLAASDCVTAVIPGPANTLWVAATGRPGLMPNRVVNLYRSLDGGGSWTRWPGWGDATIRRHHTSGSS